MMNSFNPDAYSLRSCWDTAISFGAMSSVLELRGLSAPGSMIADEPVDWTLLAGIWFSFSPPGNESLIEDIIMSAGGSQLIPNQTCALSSYFDEVWLYESTLARALFG
jgi:hypothetical protein